MLAYFHSLQTSQLPGPASSEEECWLRKNLLQLTGVRFSIHQEFFVRDKKYIRINVRLRFFKKCH